MRSRIAWFSPLPPERSGVAAYSAELLPRLREAFDIDSYPETSAHDFVWRHRRDPYDLVIYQLGNAPCHDYMWAYVAAYPGVIVLHDARLHHARARLLLQRQRYADYRDEFLYDQPGAHADFVEYAIQGMGGPIYYFWPMTRVLFDVARTVAVHNPLVAAGLHDLHPHQAIEVIRMGVAEAPASAGARAAIRQALGIPESATLFAAFGKVTAEKRIAAILDALDAVTRDDGRDAWLTIVGDREGYALVERDVAARGLADRVRTTGHVADDAIADYLAAADACLCLRWPTALETSASWLRCLAAARATVITDLAHTADVPSTVALRVDLLDEAATLRAAMLQLIDDRALRDRLARAGFEYWSANHTIEIMAADYGRVIENAARRPARHTRPAPDLPRHFLADHSETATAIAGELGVPVDVLAPADRGGL